MYNQRQRLLNSVKFIKLAITEINDSEYANVCEKLDNVIEELEFDANIWSNYIKEKQSN